MKLNDQLETLWYQAGSLAVVALACSAALSVANIATGPEIKAAEAADIQNTLQQVLPVGFFDNKLLEDTAKVPGEDGKPITVYRARKGGAVAGVVYQMEGKGYGGPIILMMGVAKDGKVLGVRVVKHTETPGLGDKVDPAKTDWVHRFEGKSLGAPALSHWYVKKDGGDFDQFAGATITPRAVVGAVRRGLQLFETQRLAMLGEDSAPASQEQAK